MSTSVMTLSPSASAVLQALPWHPLVVHAATVLLPLSLAGLVVAVLLPRLRPSLAGVSVLGLAAATVIAWIAEESGESLADQVGLPQEHARYGAWVPAAAVLALIVAAAWWRLQRGPSIPSAPPWATRATGFGVVAMALITTVITVLAGHSGAVAVWGSERPTAAAATSTETSTDPNGGTAAATSPTGGTAAGAPATGTGGHTMAEVAKHNTRTDCWSVVDGKVYNLTPWISRHPGGSGVIVRMCGVDATTAYRGQHAAAPAPVSELAKLLVGPVSAGGPAVPTATGAAAPTATAAAAPTARYSAADVARHASSSSCWAAVNGKVYDLTEWVSRHPGGSHAIAEMCGSTRGGEFLEHHAGDARANNVLAGYQIGVLG